MALFTGPMSKKLQGHKNLTKHKKVIEFSPKIIALPLFHCGCADYDLLVKEGDIVKVGTLIGYRLGKLYVPFYSSVSGKVLRVEKIIASDLKKYDHLIIENDFKDTKELPFKSIDVDSASKEELIEFTKNAGIVGCGGAGFPSYIKYQADNIETIVVNAIECEPYITADYVSSNQLFDEFVVGIKAAIKMSGAKRVIVCFKNYRLTNNKSVIDLYSSIAKEVEVKFMQDLYPMGWERTLILKLFKQRYNRLPSELGYLVNNITTIIALGQAIKYGHGIVKKIVTIGGDGINEPCNVLVPVGTQAKDIIEKLGGYNFEEGFIISGGPMMGKAIINDQFAVTSYSNGITVLKKKKHPDTLACLRCGRCSQYCPAGLQPVKIAQAASLKDKQMILRHKASDCVECGTCTFVCPSKIEVTENVRRAKRLVSEV